MTEIPIWAPVNHWIFQCSRALIAWQSFCTALQGISG